MGDRHLGCRPQEPADSTSPLVAVSSDALSSAIAAPGRSDAPTAARVLDTMPAPLCCLDDQCRVTYVNAETERLLGRSRAELLHRPVAEAFPEGVGAPMESAGRAALASGKPIAVELSRRCPQGHWYEVRAWPTPDGLAVQLLDVTARRAAQEAAARTAARSALLARVTAELSGALDGASALGRLARLVVPELADSCIVTVVDREGRPRDVGSWHGDPQRRALLARYAAVRLSTLPAASPVAQALRAGTPVIDSIESVLALMPPGEPRDLLRALGPEQAVVLPLPAQSRTVGVLTLYLDPGRGVDEDDLATAREVALVAGRTVDRVHRLSQQAQLAEGLQRSLLTDPPAMDGVAVAVRYVPAAEAARVGGDWYDAFLDRNGDPVVVIGDVVGHDTEAAAAMGQMRGLLRGIAHYSGAGPAEVLRGLDEAIVDMHAGSLATAAIARLERGGRLLRWANAGHPPPLLLDAGGTVTVLGEVEGDLLLGVDPAVHRREETCHVGPGATVLLYTDGLIERRGDSLDNGLARLRRHLAALAGTPLDQLCDQLLDRMLEGTPQDDVALVAVTVGARG
ncbi:MAG TPA: SpoIIE family protein phosphatase [Geodermatophilus sp.]|nr:SpoIIE family protein phosphatase [Geodermatophilus sp.]